MAIGTRSGSISVPQDVGRARQLGGLGFDWAMVGVSSWLMAGIFLDAWAHTHIRSTLESFFTPWHAVLDSGFFAVSALLLYALYRNQARSTNWWRALPRGYELSLLGMLIFAVGGVGDMIWHILFGIEVDLEAALSPTHLTLALGCVLLVGGPFRAAWHRRGNGGPLPAFVPVAISLAYALSMMNLMTEFIHPLAVPYAATPGGQLSEMLGVASVLAQTAMLMGWVLLAARRWRLPVGSFAGAFGLNAVFLAVLQDTWFVVPVAVLAGLAADLLGVSLRPSLERAHALRLFAFAVPAIYYTLYFVALMLAREVTWTVHLWAGAIVLAGFVGLALSYIMLPPQVPQEA